MTITDRVARVRERMAAAAGRVGRRPEEITLVAVSKRHPVSAIEEAAAAGLREFGENYVQEAQGKWDALGGRGLRWHLIGALQSNKARVAVAGFDLIQTVDRESLARRLGQCAVEAGRSVSVLVEVNLTGDPQRAGVEPESAEALCASVASTPGLALCGLMGMAPVTESAEGARPHFARLFRIYTGLPERNRRILSMGMSGDFEVAIEEGATLVRVGTALFGERPARPAQ